MSRRLRVRAFAKINLTLEVLNRRADGFHNIRTVFHTISLADTLDITVGTGAGIRIRSNVEIPGENLAARAAEEVLRASKTRAIVEIALRKRIPMGGGLGGGSTDAAAVLLALPPLLGKPLSLERLHEIGAALGSDVPFFLMGGAALGLGRGTELYPLDAPREFPGLLICPGLHVSTPAAYRALQRNQSHAAAEDRSRAVSWQLAAGEFPFQLHNDFEKPVFAQHGEIARSKRALAKHGAATALMSGSGSTVFGLFASALARDAAADAIAGSIPFTTVSRTRYARYWQRALASVER